MGHLFTSGTLFIELSSRPFLLSFMSFPIVASRGCPASFPPYLTINHHDTMFSMRQKHSHSLWMDYVLSGKEGP